MGNEIIPLIKKYSYLTIKLDYRKDRHRIYDTKKNSTALDILFKNPWNRNLWLVNPKLFLVGPSEFLIKKWQLKNSDEQGVYFYLIETENSEGFKKAKNLLTEFIREKS